MKNSALDGGAKVNCEKCGMTFDTTGAYANRIRNFKCCTLAERFWLRVVKTPTGCMEHQGCRDEWGYAQQGVNGKRRQAHRVAYELTHGPIPAGKVVMHSCDNPPCVNPAHLRLGTNAENRAECVAKGRYPKGEMYSSAKLTDEKVREIRRKRKEHGTSYYKLAEEYGVDYSAIRYACLRETWVHVK